MKKTFTLFCALLSMSAMIQAQQTTASWFADNGVTKEDNDDLKAIATGEVIASTDLFTVTADVALMYSIGNSTFGNIQNNGGSNAYSFVDITGTTQNPNQGVSMTNNFGTVDYDNATELSDIYSITAKDKDITVYVYTVYANKSFNSNKTGTVYCTLNNIKGDVVEWDSNGDMKRKNTWTYGQAGINVGADQTLYIGATGTDGMIWLFGVEAVEGTSADGEIVGGVEVGSDSSSDAGSSSEGDDAISSIQADGAVEVARYNLLGQEIIEPQKGINIVKYSNGATEKVLVK